MSLLFVNVGTGLVIDLAGWGSHNGAWVIHHRATGENNQKWQLKFVARGTVRSPDYGFSIESMHNGKVLDQYGDGTVNMYDYWGGDNQHWRFDDNPIWKRFRIENMKTHKFLTASARADHRLTVEDKRHNDPSQKWWVKCASDTPEWRDAISGGRELLEKVILERNGIPQPDEWKETAGCGDLYYWE